MNNKILIIGCPGSGKSTFARKLRDQRQLPLYYLDQIWHKPDQTNISKEEFIQLQKEMIKQEEWIIELLKKYEKGKQIIVFHTRKEVEAYFAHQLTS